MNQFLKKNYIFASFVYIKRVLPLQTPLKIQN